MRVGCEHPDFLLQKLSSRQISGWIAYYRLNPFDEWRSDMQAATVAMMIGNTNGGRKDGEPWSAADFMPEYDKLPEPERTDAEVNEDIGQKMACLAASMKAKGK